MPTRCPKCQQISEDGAPRCGYCGEPLAPRRSARSSGDAATAMPMVLAGRYRVLTKVSQKRTTAVYRGRDEQTGSLVAIKRFDTVGLVKAADRRQAIDEFQREARRLQGLRHPGLAQVLDYLVERETCYTLSQWVEGASLRDLHAQGPLPDGRVRSIGAQIADALAFLHGQQPPIIFRDLKMSHAIVGDDGRVTLLDLGLTRLFKSGQAKGSAERGTAPYEAPEQAAYSFAVPQSDIYALGTILLALAKGPAAAAAQEPSISPGLRQAIAIARQSEPERRFASAAAMRDALQGGVPLPVAPPRQPEAPTRPAIALLTKTVRIVLQPGKEQALYRVRLRNDSEAPVRVTAKSAVAWLSPREPEMELPPGISHLEVLADLRAAPRQPISVPRALAIEDGARLWVAAEVSETEPKPELVEESLDFGEVDVSAATQRLHVRNAGGGALALRLSSAHEWLHLSLASMTLASGQQAEVLVELDAARAPAGGELTRAISLDSDHGQVWAGVRFSRGRPLMVLQPRQLDFGVLQSAEPAKLALVIVNHGTATLDLRVRAGHESVSVAPDTVALPPKYKATLKVTLDAGALPPGELALAAGLRLTGNAGAVDLPLRAVVRRAILAISERSLDFGAVDAGGGQPAGQPLVVSNRGNLPLTFRAQPSIPWLRAWPADGQLDGGASTLLTISLAPEALGRPGKHQADQALVIESEGGSLTVQASVDLVKPELSVEPLSLDFGLIAAGGVRDAHMAVSNTGTGLLQWSAKTEATWLEVSPAQGVCAAGQTTDVTVRAYALGLPAEAREARATITVRGQDEAVLVQAAVAISRPELMLEPELALGQSLNFTPLSGRLLVFNRGVGDLVGTASAKLPWLVVEPRQFSVPSGSSLALRVAAEPPRDTEMGHSSFPSAISVETNGGSTEIQVSLELAATPMAELTPDRLVLRPGAEALVVVRNVGLGPYKGRVTTSAPWLVARPQMLTIRPGRRARVTVIAQPQEQEGPLRGEVVVTAGEQESRVEVEVA